MPCNSDYMNPSEREIAASRVMCLLDELAGIPFNDKEWSGYHDDIYGTNFNLNNLVTVLCGKLQNTDVSKYSLEMQTWWRDHQKADKIRVKKELEEKKTKSAKQAALDKLTVYERRLLGLE